MLVRTTAAAVTLLIVHGLFGGAAQAQDRFDRYGFDRPGYNVLGEPPSATAGVFVRYRPGARGSADAQDRASALARRRADYDELNPRVGIVHRIGNGPSLYGNLSRLYEPPTNFELEDNAAGGNATLDPMQGTVFEIGFRGGRGTGEPGSIDWDVAIYHAAIDDEILSIDDPMAPGTSLTTNIDSTTHAGIEALIRSSHVMGLSGIRVEPLVSLTVNDFSFDNDPVYGNNELPAAPGYFARAEVMFRGPGGLFFGPTLDRVDTRWADFANSYQVEAHSLIGLRGGYARDKWRTFVELRNLTDKDYVAYHYVRDQVASDAALLFRGEPLSAYVGFEMSLD